jgi:hypothetical protein
MIKEKNMGKNFTFHIDRESLHQGDFPQWVRDTILRRKLTTGKNESTISFFGLLMNGKDVRVFLPRNSLVTTQNSGSMTLAVLAMSCFDKYNKDQKSHILSDGYAEEPVGADLLTLAKDLLEDYRVNGAYIRSLKKRVINSGKIDWSRTLNSVTPFPNNSGYPIYTELHGNRIEYAAYCEVAKIHFAIISELDEMLGWWVTKKSDGHVSSRISDDTSILLKKDHCIRMLKKEVAGCYIERNIWLIKNMISYLNVDSSKGDGTAIGLKGFENVWESMLNNVLNHTVSLNSELPEPIYIDTGGVTMPTPEKKMRADTFMENKDNDIVVVVDAKYYSATSTRSLPGWSDLVKQFFYAKAIPKIRPTATIYNALVFPGGKPFASKVRVGQSEKGVYFDDDFPPIYCVYADPIDVMEHYVNKTKMIDLTNTLFRRDL